MSQGFTSRICLLLTLFLWSAICLAQRPRSSADRGKWAPDAAYPKMDCDTDAGTITGFRDFEMQSNSFGENIQPGDTRSFAEAPDTIFLCFNDRFTVDHAAGSEDLSGDPDPNTGAAVGLGFFECEPTATGPTITEIRADVCVADNGVEPLGMPLFDRLILAFGLGYEAGDYDLFIANNIEAEVTLPQLYNGVNDPDPVVFTLVPTTADDVEDGTLRAIWEQPVGDPATPAGSCVDVATDFAFTVAYLNPLEATTASTTVAGCAGEFVLSGGGPELRGNNAYTVVIENAAGQRADILTPLNTVGHGETVRYEVPAPGDYRIVVTDDISCQATVITVNHQEGCMDDDLLFVLPVATALPGDEICLPVTAENFTDITAFDFLLTFNENVVELDGINTPAGILSTDVIFNGPPSSGGTRDEGTVRITYGGGPAEPITVADEEVIFELCFTVIGPLNSQSILTVDNSDLAAEFSRPRAEAMPLEWRDGIVSITDQAFPIIISSEDETCTDTSDGSITVTANGATPPYTFSIRRTTDPADAEFSAGVDVNAEPATFTFEGLTTGQYSVQVIDATGLPASGTNQVDLGLALAVNASPTQRPSCFDDLTGSVTPRT